MIISLHIRLFALLVSVSITACADVYQWQDAGGSKHYSDRAHENSTKVKVKPGYAFVKVAKVFDGDTVKLEDGRKIRLLGINAPEVRHKGQMTETGGENAKCWLEEKLKNKKVRLVGDVEETDKYKRTLAHLFTEDKDHINLQLVELGLAAVNVHPPNLLYADQLTAAGRLAEQGGKGIWQTGGYPILPVEQLGADGHEGWLRLSGKVSTIRNSRKYVYLVFSDKFEARIEKKWLTLFPDVNSYRGQTLEVRGWLNKNRGGWSMLLRHPSAIKITSG